MDVVQMGKALVPKNRLAEFTGQKKTMAQLENEMRPPPSDNEVLQQRIKKLEDQVAALRRLIILGQAANTATRTRKLEIAEEQDRKMSRIERLFFKMYTGRPVTMGEMVSVNRSKSVADARMVLCCAIMRAEPTIPKSIVNVRYAKTTAFAYFMESRFQYATPSQKRNVSEIVKAYLATRESDDGQ